MQNLQGKNNNPVQNRLDAFNKHFKDKRFKLEHFKAAIAGIIKLDEDYHLEGVVQMLRSLQQVINSCIEESHWKGKQKESALQYVLLLDALASEFEWQVHYGVRLYEPM